MRTNKIVGLIGSSLLVMGCLGGILIASQKSALACDPQNPYECRCPLDKRACTKFLNPSELVKRDPILNNVIAELSLDKPSANLVSIE